MINSHAERIHELEKMLPDYTNHLNIVSHLHAQATTFIRILEEHHLPSDDMQGIKKQLDFSGYIAICSLDLLVISKDMLRATQAWEETFYLRQGYLCIYEALQAFYDYRHWLQKLIIPEYQEYTVQIEQLNKKIKAFKKHFDYDKTIKVIRHETIGHLDADFAKYFSHISSFDREKAQYAIGEFVGILQQMRMVAKALMIQTSKIQQYNEESLMGSVNRMVQKLSDAFAKMNV